ncbi:hypothetical protein BDZ89DRAFT_1160352 [Hymenopellis radicata]|nr:hypothetical protein BDZ89DRAFT_1160352 [Hymenopellis radicata]
MNTDENNPCHVEGGCAHRCAGYWLDPATTGLCACGHSRAAHQVPSPRVCPGQSTHFQSTTNDQGPRAQCRNCGAVHLSHVLASTTPRPPPTTAQPPPAPSTTGEIREWNPPSSFLPSQEPSARRRAGRDRTDLQRRYSPLGIAQPISSTLPISQQAASAGSSSARLLNPPMLTYSASSTRSRARALSQATGSRAPPLTPATVIFCVVLSPFPVSHESCGTTFRAPGRGPQQAEFCVRAKRLGLSFMWAPGPHSNPDQLIATRLNNALVAAMQTSGMMFVAPQTSHISAAALQARPLLWDALVCKQIARAGSNLPAKLGKYDDTETLTVGQAIHSCGKYSNVEQNKDDKDKRELLLILAPRYDIVIGPYAPNGVLSPSGTHACLYERLWNGLNSSLYTASKDMNDDTDSWCEVYNCTDTTSTPDNGTSSDIPPTLSPQVSPQRRPRRPSRSSSSRRRPRRPSRSPSPQRRPRRLSRSPSPSSPIPPPAPLNDVDQVEADLLMHDIEDMSIGPYRAVLATEDAPSAANATFDNITSLDLYDFQTQCNDLLVDEQTYESSFSIIASSAQSSAHTFFRSLLDLLQGRDPSPVQEQDVQVRRLTWITLGYQYRAFDISPAIGEGVERAVISTVMEMFTQSPRFTCVGPGCIVPTIPTLRPSTSALHYYEAFGLFLKLCLLWGHNLAPISPSLICLLIRRIPLAETLSTDLIDILHPKLLDPLVNWPPNSMMTLTARDPIVMLIIDVLSIELDDLRNMTREEVADTTNALIAHLAWGNAQAHLSADYTSIINAIQEGFNRLIGQETDEHNVCTIFRERAPEILRSLYTLANISSPESLISVLRRSSRIRNSGPAAELAQCQFMQQLCRWLRHSLKNTTSFIRTCSAEARLPALGNFFEVVFVLPKELPDDMPDVERANIRAAENGLVFHICSREIEVTLNQDFITSFSRIPQDEEQNFAQFDVYFKVSDFTFEIV